MIALTIAAIVGCVIFLVIMFALSAQNDRLHAENQRLRDEVKALNVTLSKRVLLVIHPAELCQRAHARRN